jgi:hypothetical protein
MQELKQIQNPSIESKINDIDKRLKYQEYIHREVNPKTNTFVHWDNTMISVVIISVLLSASITLLLINGNK